MSGRIISEAEKLARQFHETYERLAPSFGYETRKETRHFDEASDNGRLMIAVCDEILRALRSGRCQEWQPIETAPWEPPPVLLWKESTKEHYVAARLRGEHGPGWCTPDGYEIIRPSHWMPLPAPPRDGQAQETAP